MNTKPEVMALAERFLSPAKQASANSDPNDYNAPERREPHRPWAMKDRLGPHEVDAIAEKFANGARQADLAAEYSISLSSIKRILRSAKGDS